MNNPSANKPEPVQLVTVRRHRVDWESANLAEVTAKRAMSLDPKLANGCWYLNVRFTVYSPAPTAEFFAKVIDLRSSWLRTCRQALSNHGQRSEARQIERKGRLAAMSEVNQSDEAILSPQSQLDSAGPSKLTASLRREVVHAGKTARNLAFSGVLFIDGMQIPPRTWQAMAEELLGPERSSRRSKRRRRAGPSGRPSIDPGPRSGSADLPQPPTGGA